VKIEVKVNKEASATDHADRIPELVSSLVGCSSSSFSSFKLHAKSVATPLDDELQACLNII